MATTTNYNTSISMAYYSPDFYSPPSHDAWAAASVSAGPKLGWKLPNTPAGQLPRQSTVPAPYSSVQDQPYPAAQVPGRTMPRCQTNAANAAGPPPSAALLGPGVAGYTSVVTRTPISPSGYAVQAPQQVRHQQQQHLQDEFQHLQASSLAYQNMQRTGVGASTLASTSRDSQGSRPEVGSAGPAGRSGVAAALAVLAGSNARGNTAPVGAGNSNNKFPLPDSYPQQYTAKNYGLSSPATNTASTSRGSMLSWNVRDPAQSSEPTQSGYAVAGRRAAAPPTAALMLAPGAAGVIASASSTYVPSRGNDGQRPPSQDASAGLQKLKQLSSARLARRIGTPPLPGAGGSSNPTSSFLAGPAVCSPAAGPTTLTGPQSSPNTSQPCSSSSDRCRAATTTATSGQRVSAAVHSTASRAAAHGGTVARAAGQQPPGLTAGVDSEEFAVVNRQPCPSCGRCFAAAALQHHVRICDIVFGSKRKAFNIQAQRLQGTGAAAVTQTSKGRRSASGRQQQQLQQQRTLPHDRRPAISAAEAKKSKWQLQSQQLRAAMRAARPHASGFGPDGSGYDLGPGQTEVEDTRVQCPHCGRRFAELVAERHIPKCADIIAQPTRLKAGGGTAAYMLRRNNSQSKR